MVDSNGARAFDEGIAYIIQLVIHGCCTMDPICAYCCELADVLQVLGQIEK
jgi:hypothetical protein